VKARLVPALLLAALWPSPAQAGRALLAIGSNVGLPDEPVLAHAVSDARRMAELLQELGGVDRARVLADPTPAQALAALAALAVDSRSGDVALVYFSGHGDQDSLHLAGDRLPLERLGRAVAALPAPLKVVIVDACRAAAPAAKGLVRASPPVADLQSSLSHHQGLVTLLASSSGEVAQESSQLGGGVFTYFLLGGLRGSADADDDRRVTLQEAYEFAFEHTVARSVAATGVAQRPEARLALEGTGPLVLTVLDPVDARLVLPPGGDTHFYVYEKGSAAALVEAWGQPGRATTLALPAGRYVVQRQVGGETGVAPVTLRAREHATLEAPGFRPVPPESMLGRGGRFEVHPRLVALTAGLSSSPSLPPVPTVGAWLSGARRDLVVGAGLSAGRIVTRTAQNDVELSRLDLALGGGWQWVGRRLTAYALGEVVARWQRQRTRDWRVALPAGAPAHQRIDDLLAGGLGTRLALALPVSERLAVLLEASGRALALRLRQAEGPDHLSIAPELALAGGLAGRF
jgi:hypothetical protein